MTMTRLAVLLAVVLILALGFMRVIPQRVAFVVVAVLVLGALLAYLVGGGF